MKIFTSRDIVLAFFVLFFGANHAELPVTIAILAKDKAHTLPLYLQCIEQQSWPKKRTNLYIRTNNNNDNTTDILRAWIENIGHEYNAIFFDDSDVEQKVERFRQHEWNEERFKVLGTIRQTSLDWAYEHASHYFVADCDNFILPETIESLLRTNLPIVAPLLRTAWDVYSNFHAAIDENGYLEDCPLYDQLLGQTIKGLIEVPVVHCTYLIRYPFLPYLTYDDDSYRYEYVIFSDCARELGIPQYLDTRSIYGGITTAETTQEFEQEQWPLRIKRRSITGNVE